MNEPIADINNKIHPWRLCPHGMHWVDDHEKKVKVTPQNPSGFTSVAAHCRNNPSRKDQLYKDEMLKIAKDNFPSLNGAPKSDDLGFKIQNANQYDIYIRGWVVYWNEVLKPKEALDPDLVKALIGSESSFNPNIKVKASKNNFARGLMQVTDQTLKILGDEKGELKDHYITLTRDDMLIPELNISAGVRRLYRKQQIATYKLKREANWIETIADYKAYLDDILKHPDIVPAGMEQFFKLYRKIKA